MKKPAIKVSDLFFFYDKIAALEGVNFEIEPQEFIAIFGPNGGGKTTLLQLLLGLLKPQRGEVLLLGEAPEKSRHRVGYVPQRVKLDRHFPITVLDVVMMGALTSLNAWGRYPKTTRLLAQEALERVGMGAFQQMLFGSLSGGEAQRVLIARAILNAPELLILDEPTAHVDEQGEQSIHKLLKELNSEMTIVLVTHDLQTIIDKTDRLLCVQKTVTSLQAKEICEHFALGLYHTPLVSPSHFVNLGRPPC